jgi:hypothetical protein
MLDDTAADRSVTAVPSGTDDRKAAPAPIVAASAAATSAEAVLLIERPAAGQTKLIDMGGARQLKFSFSLSDVTVTMLDVDAVLTFPDGARLIVPGLFLRLVEPEPTQVRFLEVATPSDVVIAAAGDVRLSEQLPHLAHSLIKALEGQSGKNDDEAPRQTQVVQVTANQSYSHTPLPKARPFPSVGTGEGDSLQENNGRFARRVTGDQDQGAALKSEGAITDRQEQPRRRATVSRQQCSTDHLGRRALKRRSHGRREYGWHFDRRSH